MSSLSNALAARRYERNEGVKQLSIYKGATRPALDWIAKALPFVKLDLERRRFADYDDGENKAYGDRDIATLTALIAQAEGTAKEGEE